MLGATTGTTAAVTAAAAGRPKGSTRRLAAAVNLRRGHGPLRRPQRDELLAASASEKTQRRQLKRWVVGASGPSDANGWRVKQVVGDGKVLLDQLREVADLLADGFASGRTSKDLLNGLVQKVRDSME
jgi:hypothetical protein